MSDQQFIEKASIAAMQSILSHVLQSGATYPDISTMVVNNAKLLLERIRKEEYPTQENIVKTYDEHKHLNERINQLEHTIQNLTRIIEQRSEWINKPNK